MLWKRTELRLFSLSPKKGGGFGGMFGMLKGLVGSKSLSREDMEPVLEKMKDHLIGMTPLSLTVFILQDRKVPATHCTPSTIPQQRM